MLSPQPLEAATDRIIQAFRPDPIECEINGKVYFIERVTEGWSWRDGEGDMQENFDIAPFKEAWECQQSAIAWEKGKRRAAV